MSAAPEPTPPRSPGRRRAAGGRVPAGRLTAGVLSVGLVLTACSTGPGEEPGARPTPSVHVLPVPTHTPAPTVAEEAPAHAAAADGTVLPNGEHTPGGILLDVPRTEICAAGYEEGAHRPKTEDLVEAFAAYGVTIRQREEFAVDHLVPTGLGGSDDPENLWPQPRGDGEPVAEKDRLEEHLRLLVCSGTVPLAEAQSAISRDWRAAAGRYLRMRPGSAARTTAPVPQAPRDNLDETVAAGPCPREGVVGRTRERGERFTCTPGAGGVLGWRKRW